MRTGMILAAAVAALAPTFGAARPAQCYVEVDGAVVMDGPCDFTALGRDGSFQVAASKDEWFQVTVTAPGLAEGWWSSPRWATEAQASLGRLARNDACWSNAAATVCAW